MERRRSLLKIAALRSERERQAGVNCTKGYLQSQDAGLLFDGPRTLECFFKYIPSDKTQVIAGLGNSMIEIQVLPTNHLRVYCGGGNATVGIVPGDSYLVDVAYDGTTAICYLNGTEVARFPVTGYKITDSFRTGSNTYIPQGSFVFCRHYNYAISAEEAAAHYNDGDPAGYVLPTIRKYGGPFNISGLTSYTWTGETDLVYYRELLLGRFIQTGAVVMIKGSVSDYQSGEPFVYVGNRQAMIPAQNGSFTLKVINNRDNIDRIYYYGGTHLSDRRLTITIDSVALVGCVAEYLPQNLVGQWHEKPFDLSGQNSYTWTGETDTIYSRSVLLGRTCKSGTAVSVKGTVSDYQSGAPFIYAGRGRVDIPAKDGDFTVMVTGLDAFDRVSYYGGLNGSDRRLTITIDSVDLIPDVALAWLDSARQLPLNDEYLPPLLQSDGGYDLTASGAPQIIIK
jgi:hypothetical protein